MTTDPSIRARQLAIHFIKRDVDNGCSEIHISQSCHAGGRSHKFWHDASDGFGGYQASIGGYYDIDTATGLARKSVPSTKVLIQEVDGIKGVWIFSLHEIYQECKKGQLSLL